MGLFRFLASADDHMPPEAFANAYLAGMEGIPWRSTNRRTPSENGMSEYVLERSIGESGNLYIPWRIEGHGELMLSTASLMERDSPYHLSLELARGVLNRLRSQLFDWEMAGLVTPDALKEAVATASSTFIEAVIALPDSERVVASANEAIRQSLDAGEALCAEYTRQALAVRHQSSEQLPTLLGCTLSSRELSEGEQDSCAESFNTTAVSFKWRDVEQTAGKHEWDAFDQQIDWCHANGMRVIGGPLLQLDTAHIPDWIYLWEDDFDQIQAYIAQYIRATASRYRGRVHVWHCAARMNVTGAISLNEEQRLRLVVSSVDELRRNDPQAAILLSFDQPWAEYLATNERDLSPLHLADLLVRADLGIAGVGVELNIGYSPGGSFPRTPLEYSRQLDRWSALDLPLVVFLSAPSERSETSNAQRAVGNTENAWTPEGQAELADRLVPLILAKPYVQGIVWNQLADTEQHEFAHGGLLDAQSVAKPALQRLSLIRQQHLT
ncbi:MAG: hypothetical protein CMJ64_03870 [Planctomycetaceae bacterium]|nr:hypothetical protein [Planctomycetaceae bacterium]